jgi:DNA adenine methylase
MGYRGSKAASGAYQAIIAAMPPHDVYIETHLGSGAVMQRKPRAARSIGLDLDDACLKRFECEYRVELVRQDCVAFLEMFPYKDAGRVLVYADPPYLHDLRRSPRRYRYDYNLQDHERLIATLKAIPCAVMLSGYPSALYDELLSGWRTLEFQVMTHGGPRTEKLWLNFPESSSHWSRYAGVDFTDRQRIKRKAERWAGKYHALPALERQAVLSAMLAVGESKEVRLSFCRNF